MSTEQKTRYARTKIVEEGNPLGIEGLAFWLDPTSLSALSSGASISEWANQNPQYVILEQGQPITYSGELVVTQKDDAFQDNASVRPQYSAVLPSVEFNGTDQFLQLPDFSHFTSGHLFVVLKNTASGPTAENYASPFALGTSGTDTVLRDADGIIFDDFGSTTQKTSDPTGKTFQDWTIYSVYSAPNDWQSFINGDPLYATAVNTVSFSNEPVLGSGASLTQFWEGGIAEVLLYDRKLSQVESDQIHAYLAAKYSITLEAVTQRVQTGTARVSNAVTANQTASARIQTSATQFQYGSARIGSAVSEELTGLARISRSESEALSGNARIQTSVQETLTGTARIINAGANVQTGNARIQRSESAEQSGIARVTISLTESLDGTARVTTAKTASITGNARVLEIEQTGSTVYGSSETETLLTKRIYVILRQDTKSTLATSGILTSELGIDGFLYSTYDETGSTTSDIEDNGTITSILE